MSVKEYARHMRNRRNVVRRLVSITIGVPMTDSARLLQTLQLAFTLALVGPCVSRGRVVDLSATSKQIGRAIAISPRTVEAHRAR